MDFKKGIVASAVAAAMTLFPTPSVSYSPGAIDGTYCGKVIEKGTHPLLARKSVELYEQKNGATFTAEQKLLIEKGAIEEDSPEFCYMRSFNHFTEVGTGNGLWGFNSSQQWSQSPQDQLGDIPFHLMPLVVQQWYKGLAWLNDINGKYPYGNHTWQRAISEKNVESLGHILHLLQDATLPAHVRNDAHPGIIKLGKLEEANIHSTLRGDSYESWSEDNSKLVLLSASNIPVYKTLDEIFEDVVQITGNNFFSDDTIGNYPLPAVSKLVTKKEGKRTYYYNTVEGVEVPIARKSLLSAFMDKTIVTHKPHYIFDNKVLEAEWKIQGTRAVEIGAAAINLYVESIADKCVTHALKVCDSGGGGVYWQDSCGKLEDKVESCANGCVNGGCVAAPICGPSSGCSDAGCIFYEDFSKDLCKWDVKGLTNYNLTNGVLEMNIAKGDQYLTSKDILPMGNTFQLEVTWHVGAEQTGLVVGWGDFFMTHSPKAHDFILDCQPANAQKYYDTNDGWKGTPEWNTTKLVYNSNGKFDYYLNGKFMHSINPCSKSTSKLNLRVNCVNYSLGNEGKCFIKEVKITP